MGNGVALHVDLTRDARIGVGQYEQGAPKMHEIGPRTGGGAKGLLGFALDRPVELAVAHIVHEYPDGRRDAFAFVADIIRMTIHGIEPSVLVDGVAQPSSLTPFELGYDAMDDSSVALVLRLMGQEVSWSSLYKALEAIEEDVGGKLALHGRRFVEAAALGKSIRTADAFETATFGGRHARSSYRGSTPPMAFEEARCLIYELVRAWLAPKAHELG